MLETLSSAKKAVSHWSLGTSTTARYQLSRCSDGLINQSYVVTVDDAPLAILQQLNTSIFDPCVHEDIHAVTMHLRACGVPTPVLLPTREGKLWYDDEASGVWRCFSYEGNRTLHRIGSPEQAFACAGLVARFHGALGNLSHTFRSVRPGAHNTAQHMATLTKIVDEALRQPHRFPLIDDVARIADSILAYWQGLAVPEGLPRRVIHGDLKVSNIRFLDERPWCLIDLDTMARESIDVELGDALRSWCNPGTEDDAGARFDLALFEAAVRGYAKGASDSAQRLPCDGSASSGAAGLSSEEWGSLVGAVARISIELAARFAADALSQRYFGWDSSRYESRGHHNLVRARGQYAFAMSVRKQWFEACGIVERLR